MEKLGTGIAILLFAILLQLCSTGMVLPPEGTERLHFCFIKFKKV